MGTTPLSLHMNDFLIVKNKEAFCILLSIAFDIGTTSIVLLKIFDDTFFYSD